MKRPHSHRAEARPRKNASAPRRRRWLPRAIVGAGVAILVTSGKPSANPWDVLPRLCEEAAARASARSGVPLSVLRAIALTETGRTRDGAFRPWPWTVNMEGAGKWFDSFEEARAYVAQHHARGARSYDVGCFQINYRWHAQHFASLDAMFDPLTNARYAARFLSELHGETGDWSAAAGAFHSRTEVYASRYRKIFDRHRQRLGGSPEVREERYAVSANDNQPVEPATPAAPRANAYPLLRGGTTGALGSLVPVDARAGRPLFLATAGTEG